MNIGKIKRGDIYSLKLDGADPVLIIQSNIGRNQMLTAVPVLYGNKKMRVLPTHVSLPKVSGLESDSFILSEQIRIIDYSVLSGYIGKISSQVLKDL